MVENKSSLQGCNLFSCCLVYSGNLGKVSKTYLRNPSEKSPLCIIFFLSRKKLTDFGGTPPPFPPTLRTDSTKKLLAMDWPKLKMMIENGSKDSILSNQSPNSFSIYPLNGKSVIVICSMKEVQIPSPFEPSSGLGSEIEKSESVAISQSAGYWNIVV